MTAALHLSTPIEIKLQQATGAGTFSGYASTFDGEPDSYGDVIAPGAFSATLQEHKAAGTTPAMLWAHDASQPIGVWTDVRQDQKGLLVSGRLTLGTSRGAEARALMLDGALGMSIGFLTVQQAAGTGGAKRILKALDLFEISLTPMPANHNARIVEAKAMASTISDITSFEKFLREAGFSKSFARTCASRGFAAAARAENTTDTVKTLADEIRSLAATIKLERK